MKPLGALAIVLSVALSGCGLAYFAPAVNEGISPDAKVRVEPITAESVLLANRAAYVPRALPAAFSQVAGSRGLRGAGAPPPAAFEPESRPAALETRLPPAADPGPYRIGVGDVVMLATPSGSSSVEQLSGLLAAQNARQGYTVQDDGSISIPNVGRVALAGLTIEDAEAVLFQKLLQSQLDPSFSLEITEFNSKKVSVGGAVKTPVVVPVTLAPLYLDEALAAAGGVSAPDLDYASVRLYRDGTLYQIPLSKLYARAGMRRIRLLPGDSVFVDAEYDLDQAAAYFQEQITLSRLRQEARTAALNELRTEVELRRASLNERRENFQARLELGAERREHVYLTGEVKSQGRWPLPYEQTASLADALYDAAGGVPADTGNMREIYVLRGSPDPREFEAVTAWHLDAGNVSNLILATRFELRPDDIIFVAQQPVTRWANVIRQITPSLITTTIAAAKD
ncbi:polysaccharide biosynthesis/export family protein [Phaeovulum vinaykumarii]|uniref:Polysaccharide export outer membrane protein n=1 Tax=Phaeovulum vinaykumarii TaxID=407234 RepID=A0A1N7N5W5_9RHOB|nr:polysaccharide biosynthesis/export family protein [Phaeovulum vinaykumarii]SIS93531.1 polysaccharide export outer membrane protein [Phaeovulum vinaykumarii]